MLLKNWIKFYLGYKQNEYSYIKIVFVEYIRMFRNGFILKYGLIKIKFLFLVIFIWEFLGIGKVIWKK